MLSHPTLAPRVFVRARRGKSTTSKLEFSLDGEDRTGLEMKITQVGV